MNKDEEVDFIMKIIDHPAGFNLVLFSSLIIHTHNDGYEVAWEEGGYNAINVPPIVKQKYFTSLREAAQFFVDKRYERELGLDFAARLSK